PQGDAGRRSAVADRSAREDRSGLPVARGARGARGYSAARVGEHTGPVAERRGAARERDDPDVAVLPIKFSLDKGPGGEASGLFRFAARVFDELTPRAA